MGSQDNLDSFDLDYLNKPVEEYRKAVFDVYQDHNAAAIESVTTAAANNVKGAAQLMKVAIVIGIVIALVLILLMQLAMHKVDRAFSNGKLDSLIILFLVNLLVIIFFRGIGMAMFGDEKVGGGTYIQWIVTLGIIFFSKYINLNKKSALFLTIGFAILPIINPISPPHVDVGLSESQPVRVPIFIVSFKSPSPQNKLIRLAAKLIPAAKHPLQ